MEQIYRIGIDHGYGNIKTAHYIFESGVIEMRSELINKVHTVVDDIIVKKVLKDGTADIGEKYLKATSIIAKAMIGHYDRKEETHLTPEELLASGTAGEAGTGTDRYFTN